MLSEEACWDAVVARDAAHDGEFVFGVVTTGIYCRASCPSRRPLRANVRFYGTPAEAERAGLRPCKRCRPNTAGDIADGRIVALCEYIRRHSNEAVTLRVLSEQSGISAGHVQRKFKEIVGVTPRQYAEACRLEKLKGGLRMSDTVTEAIYEAGFSSSSRVYQHTDARLGMTPATYRSGGEGVTMSYAAVETAVGLMMVAATDRGLSFVQFGDSQAELFGMLQVEYPSALLEPADPNAPQLQLWIQALDAYLAGEPPHPDLPVDVRATAFQLKVWNYLQTIPRGEVRSYAQVASGIGQPSASRAVAQACASNRVGIVIPCHRVIRGDGGLGGFRWGIERKRKLLEAEGAALAS